MKFKIEKSSQRLFGILIFVLVVVFLFATLGWLNLFTWLGAIVSWLFALFSYSEVGFATWWRNKGYKSWTTGDFVVIFGTILGTFFLINGFLIFNAIRNVSPDWLVNTVSQLSTVGGIALGIFALFLIFTGKPKA